jgi:proteasome accessory factor C
MTDNAASQLRRILAVIPELADDREHSLADIAAKVGVDRSTLLSDLESLATRFDEPGGFVEGVQLYLDAETVSLVSNHFRRPMRLTLSELRALDLGLTMLRTEVPPDDRSCIESARGRVRKAIAKMPADQLLEELHYGESEKPGSAEHLSVLRAAHRDHCKVEVEYRKADSAEVTRRVVRPYSFVISSGAWYMVAHCELSEGLRIFRVDRIAGVKPIAEEYEIPDTFRLEDAVQPHRAFSVNTPRQMRVRYSPRIARWIAEREDGVMEEDGSFVVSHPLADIGWGMRHVLQYGAEAEVLDPPELRAALAERLDRITTALANQA